jgi:hypothetical protein
VLDRIEFDPSIVPVFCDDALDLRDVQILGRRIATALGYPRLPAQPNQKSRRTARPAVATMLNAATEIVTALPPEVRSD